ncbi:MAG: PD-(D/E)XK nuclease family protein, partial [Limnochordia bacterium]
LLAASRMLPGKAHGIAFYNIKDGRRTGIWLESARQRLRIGKSDGILSDAEWPQLIDEFHQSLKACLDQILNGYFPAAPVREDICSYCPYRAICRKE